jgi:hypothetical protein
MSQTVGVADHAAPSTGWRGWVARARKAVVAFVATGALAGLAPAISTFDWSNLSWGSFWTGIGSGFVAAVAVYVVRNAGSKLGLTPELELLVEQLIEQKLHAKYNGPESVV